MVKGPCRGKMCDYWGRVRIRKSTIKELVDGIREAIMKCECQVSLKRDDALREYWYSIGIRDMKRLCEEEPDLCTKMTEAEVQAQVRFTQQV
ncbi:MAG: hypothetical protein ACFFFO_04740 [Candidatus Thorarchaeota archaeon]